MDYNMMNFLAKIEGLINTTSIVQFNANPFAIFRHQASRISDCPVFDLSSPSHLHTSPRIDVMKENHGSSFYILFPLNKTFLH